MNSSGFWLVLEKISGPPALQLIKKSMQVSGIKESISATELFAGGGEMGALMRAKDWSRTPLGPPEDWPQSLKVAVRIILLSRYPMFLWWGKDLVNLYNDQYVPMLGKKHPASLGESGHESWKDIWSQLSPRVNAVMQRGEATFDDALLLMTDRHGYLEETYFTFSYSPLPNDEGRVGGLFCAVTEETDRVISERRMALLRQLATANAEARTPEAVCSRAVECLEEANKDLPFVLIYMRDRTGKILQRSCAAGIAPSHAAAPATIEPESNEPWPVKDVLAQGAAVSVGELSSRFKNLPSGAWSTPPEQAYLVPLAQQGQANAAGVLIAGMNPHREIDEEFGGFVSLVAGQIAAALANANAYEAERKRAEALAELDQAKTAFFSNVSHEFRTPLTLMLGPTEDALSSHPPALSGSELQRVYRNELRLLKLVNTLLDFSRLEMGRIKAKYQATDLAAFTAELASLFRSAVTRAKLAFKLEMPTLPQPVFVDREMWEKIVLNLLSNALKSTFEGGITVAVRDAGDHAELSVSDTGTGIPEHEIGHLFERFRRIENARRRTHEGSGIGLALVNELVQMHGGKVEVRSVVDQGSTFTVSIPYGTSHLSAGAVVAEDSSKGVEVERNAYVQEALSWLQERDFAAQESSLLRAIRRDQPVNLHKAIAPSLGRVLLVDDNRDVLEYVEKLLSRRFEVTTAENGRVALEKALANPPDIVLSDVMMPEMDGFELLAALRKAPTTGTIPVILLSARAGEEPRVEGMEAGADDYLIKPFSARELLARVQAHIKIAQFRKQALQQQMELKGELQEARRIATEAIEHITDRFFAIDSSWRFTYLNPKARLLAQKTGATKDLLNKSIWEVFPDLEGTEIARQYRLCMEKRIPVQFESPFTGRWFSVRAYPSPGGIVVYAVDITDQRAAERELRVKQEYLVLTQSIARIGTWELDIEHEYLTISREFAEIAGLSAHNSRLRYADFLSLLFVSTDRKKTEEALQLALRKKKEFSIELRLRRPDGEVRLVSNRGKVFYNQGKPVVLGVLVDISPAEKSAGASPIIMRTKGNKKKNSEIARNKLSKRTKKTA